MRELLALGMMMVGVSVAAIGPVGAAIALARIVDARRMMAGDPANGRIAILYNAYKMLLFAIVSLVGICVLVFGGVVGFGMSRWAAALPGALLLVATALAGYTRWQFERERASH